MTTQFLSPEQIAQYGHYFGEPSSKQLAKYFHLDDFADIEVGDFIRKGQPVGKLGVTGYANGYHLHWELTVNGVPVDPVEWTKKVF